MTKISYVDLSNLLLQDLHDREREVLQKRNALLGFPKHTLEQIGQSHKITRERVRQIERDGLNRIKELLGNGQTKPLFANLHTSITDQLSAHGGIMADEHLKEKLLAEKDEQEMNALNFILGNIMSDEIERIDEQDDFQPFWKMKGIEHDEILEIAKAIKELIAGNGKPIDLSGIISGIKDEEYWQKIEALNAQNEAILEALLRTIKNVDQNILSQWGLNDWTSIHPKRMTDKAYLILLREKKPLHFVDVADLINQANFDHKKACPATVHNELILDDKYVLVGRGIYGLKEWGYQPGTVSSIIENLLKENGSMSKDRLAEEVLKQRFIQKTTITLALMDKGKFKKNEQGEYTLA